MFDFSRIAVTVLVGAAACWAPGASAATAETYGPTGPNDTLWSIATRLRPDGATIEQTMLALTRLNPDAFVGPRGNLVMSGATLRAPTLAQAQAVTAERAVRIVADPDVHWAEVLGVLPDEGDRSGAPPVSLADEGDAPAPGAFAPARPAAQGASTWQTRAEDAEFRAAELERERDDLQSQLDEQTAVAERAERRVRQLEAQARRPRSTLPFAKELEEEPMLFWGGLGGAGFFLFLVGLLMGRRHGRARSKPKGVAAKPRVTARPVADFAAAEAIGEADSEVVGPVRVAGTNSGRPPNPAPSSPLPPHNQGAGVGRAAHGNAQAPTQMPQPPAAPSGPANVGAPPSVPPAQAQTVAPQHGAPSAAGSPQFTGGGFDNAGSPATIGRPGDLGTPAPQPYAGHPTPAVPPSNMERAPAAAYATTTKLNLARAYVDLNDRENARAVCLEVLREGNDAEREVARALLQRLDEPTR